MRPCLRPVDAAYPYAAGHDAFSADRWGPIAVIAVVGASFGMANEDETIETASSMDATCRWVLRQRADGRFDYAEYRYVDLRPDGQVEGYCQRCYTSGLFDTVQAARNDALVTISWLPGQL